MKFRAIHVVIFVVGLFTSSVARAQQFGFVQPSFFGDITLNQSVSSATRSYVLGQYGEEVGADATPTAQLADLRFRDDAQAARSAQRALAAAIARNTGTAQQELERELASGVLQNEFATMTQAIGLDKSDFADVVAAHHIVMWQIVNGASDPSQSEVAAVSRQMRSALASDPNFQAMDNHSKQYEAETLILTSMLAALIYQPQLRQGNHAAVREAQDAVHSYMMAQGLDLKSVSLNSESGFSAR
jgi:hypothetical protein